MALHIISSRTAQGRRFGRALVFSAALHLAVLWPAQLPRLSLSAPPSAASKLHGVLRVRPSHAAVVEPGGVPSSALGRVAGRAPSVRQPARLIAEARGDLGQSAGARPGGGNPLPVRSGGTAPEVAVPSPPVEATMQADAASDPQVLRDYRFALARAMALVKHYPPTTEGGVVVLGVLFPGPGLPGRASVLRSCGHRALDEAARRMLDAAMLETAVPPALQGRRLAFELPVEFEPGSR